MQQDKLELLMDESGLVECTEKRRDCSCVVINPTVTKSNTSELETLHKVNKDLASELKVRSCFNESKAENR